MQQLATDIEQLQMKVAFQEDTIEALNSALIAQQRQIDNLEFKLKQVMGKIEAIDPSAGEKEGAEPPPPHY
ncbi:MAG: SlyX protein [Paraglaciecola sp.]|jgi:SlyX protein